MDETIRISELAAALIREVALQTAVLDNQIDVEYVTVKVTRPADSLMITAGLKLRLIVNR